MTDQGSAPRDIQEVVERAFAEFIQQDAFLPPGWNPMPMLTRLKDHIKAALAAVDPPGRAPVREQEGGEPR